MAIFSIFRSTVIVVCEGVRELSSFLPTSVPGTDRTTGLSASDTINSTSYSLALTIVVIPGTATMSPGPMVTVGGREGGRVHKLTLVKPAQAGYGFSIRGGVEHQLGIFVSEVEVGSEAHTQVWVVLVVVVK